MNDTNDDVEDDLSPEEDEQWCAEVRESIQAYLLEESVDHGEVAEWPTWDVPGVVGVWPVASRQRPDLVGWWVIAGDLPTDHVSAIQHESPRAAVEAFATRWSEMAKDMRRGEHASKPKVGSPEDWAELAEMLESRAETLLEWVADESLWID